MFEERSGDVVPSTVGSQSVLVGEDVTDLKRSDLARGFRRIDLAQAERKVLVPGEKTRAQAEKQYGVEEVP